MIIINISVFKKHFLSTNLELGNELAMGETFKRALKDMPALMESPVQGRWT